MDITYHLYTGREDPNTLCGLDYANYPVGNTTYLIVMYYRYSGAVGVQGTKRGDWCPACVDKLTPLHELAHTAL